jgi:hypothetical protein
MKIQYDAQLSTFTSTISNFNKGSNFFSATQPYGSLGVYAIEVHLRNFKYFTYYKKDASEFVNYPSK